MLNVKSHSSNIHYKIKLRWFHSPEITTGHITVLLQTKTLFNQVWGQIVHSGLQLSFSSRTIYSDPFSVSVHKGSTLSLRELLGVTEQVWTMIHPRPVLRGLRGSYFPNQGSILGPLLWKCRVLTTGPPGNSHPLSPHFFPHDSSKKIRSLQI